MYRELTIFISRSSLQRRWLPLLPRAHLPGREGGSQIAAADPASVRTSVSTEASVLHPPILSGCSFAGMPPPRAHLTALAELAYTYGVRYEDPPLAVTSTITARPLTAGIASRSPFVRGRSPTALYLETLSSNPVGLKTASPLLSRLSDHSW